MTNFLEIPMNSNSSTPHSPKQPSQQSIDPMVFACRFFKAREGIVESQEKYKTVLLPRETAQALEVDEIFKIGYETDSPSGEKHDDSNLYAIQFHTPLLDRMVDLAGSARPFVGAALKFDYIKSQGFDRLIEEQFTFIKSKIKVLNTAAAKTRYLMLTCWYTAQSDELEQGLLDICFNLDSGAVIPDMAPFLDQAQKDVAGKSVQGCSRQEIENINTIVRRYGTQMVADRLSDFVKSMNRRYRRDAKNLEEYYGALAREMKESLDRSGLSDRLIQERQDKIAMVPRELAAKQKDLLNKYSIHVDFKPVAAMALSTPCVKVMTKFLSGRQSQPLTLTYNPVTKKMDPLVCRSCGTSTYSVGTGQGMHLSCLACVN